MEKWYFNTNKFTEICGMWWDEYYSVITRKNLSAGNIRILNDYMSLASEFHELGTMLKTYIPKDSFLKN